MRNILLFRKPWLSTFLLLPALGFAQVEEAWVARHNGPGNDFDATKYLALDKEGNVYIAGSSTGAGTGRDYSTIKYNSAGVRQWEARYNGPGNHNDEPYSIAVDDKGNVYVTGTSKNETGPHGAHITNDYATIKYSSAGALEWVARYNGPENGVDWAKSIGVDRSGNVYVTGESGLTAETSSDYVTIKYDADGIEQWVARYDGPGKIDAANALALDEAGNVYVTGRSTMGMDPAGEPEVDADYTTIKYDENGNELWVRRYDGPTAGNYYDEALAITLDGYGNVYVTGHSAGDSVDNEDYATVKYDAHGNEQWAARYNGPGNYTDLPQSLAVDSLQNVYVTGLSAPKRVPEGQNFYDYATIRYDANGNEVWVRRYNGPGDGSDLASSLALDGEGNLYVTGQSKGFGTDDDFATIKYNAAGVEEWVARYNGPMNGPDGPGVHLGYRTSHPIAVDGSGNVYVAGNAFVGGGVGCGCQLDQTIQDLMSGFDYTTIKYSQHSLTTGVEPSTPVSESFSRIDVYPNPISANDSELRISGFEIVKEIAETQVLIMKITGEVVFEINISPEEHGSPYLINLNGQLVPGLYLVSRKTNGGRLSKRLLVK